MLCLTHDNDVTVLQIYKECHVKNHQQLQYDITQSY